MAIFYTRDDLEDFISIEDKNWDEYLKFKSYLGYTGCAILLISGIIALM